MDLPRLGSDASVEGHATETSVSVLDETATLPRRRATSGFGIRTGSPADRVREIREALNGAGTIALPRTETLGVPTLGERFERQHGRLARGFKRGFDLVAGSLLVAIFAPLWLTIAVLIKSDSPGPILFRQRRIGRDGKAFWMLKFRTMIDGADEHKGSLLHLNEAADGLFKMSMDPRVTRVGRWLRATCLDELPQLLQVITGKMSLVGPRPLVPEEDARICGRDRHRLQIRPGMTGVWQVNGAWKVPIPEMVKLDLGYVENWSPWLDLKLLFQTAGCVVFRRGL